MTIDLYHMAGSAPCTAVRLLAGTLGIDLNLKPTDLMKKEHLAPEYIKINPQHTIPTLVDDGFALWESRAILIYLVEKYGSDSSLYPTCPQARAVIHQRLFFDLGTLYPRFADYFYPQFMAKQPADPEKLTKIHDALDFVNIFLDGKTYIAGNELSVADYSLCSIMITFDLCGIDIARHENVAKWFATVKEAIGQSDIVDEHVIRFKAFFDSTKN